MKANKMVVAALSLALSLSMVACNKKENTPANGAKTTTEQNPPNNVPWLHNWSIIAVNSL